MVNWGIPPEAGRNGIIISYIVQLLDTHGAVVRNETVAVQDPTFDSPQSLAHNFTSLKPYTRYLWRVAATTTAGAGPFSSASHFRTQESSESLRVCFVLLLSLQFGTIQCYIYYHCISTTNTVVQCCQCFAKIHFSMYSCLHPTVPGIVSELRYHDYTDTSVNITWRPPKEPNGVIVAYIVEQEVYQVESAINVGINTRRPTHIVIQALGKLLPIYDTQAHLSASMCTSTCKSGYLKITPIAKSACLFYL